MFVFRTPESIIKRLIWSVVLAVLLLLVTSVYANNKFDKWLLKGPEYHDVYGYVWKLATSPTKITNSKTSLSFLISLSDSVAVVSLTDQTRKNNFNGKMYTAYVYAYIGGKKMLVLYSNRAKGVYESIVLGVTDYYSASAFGLQYVSFDSILETMLSIAFADKIVVELYNQNSKIVYEYSTAGFNDALRALSLELDYLGY